MRGQGYRIQAAQVTCELWYLLGTSAFAHTHHTPPPHTSTSVRHTKTTTLEYAVNLPGKRAGELGPSHALQG